MNVWLEVLMMLLLTPLLLILLLLLVLLLLAIFTLPSLVGRIEIAVTHRRNLCSAANNIPNTDDANRSDSSGSAVAGATGSTRVVLQV